MGLVVPGPDFYKQGFQTEKHVNAVVVTPDGQRAVSGSEDGTLKVWDLSSGRELRTPSGHSSLVTAVAVSPDGERAVSASYDKTRKVWELETDKVLATFTCDSAAHCCAYSDPLKLIVAGDAGAAPTFPPARRTQQDTLTR